MRPTLEHGDLVLVRRTERASVGDVVVCKDPKVDGEFLIKRIGSDRSDGDIWLTSDAGKGFKDSSFFGFLAASDVVGVAKWTLWPRVRRL